MTSVRPKFVFICAAGHSGSTLLDLLLGAHSAGISLGEITQLPKNISLNSVCSCGDHLSQCAFWNPVITEFGRLIDVDLWQHPYRLNLGFIKAGREIDPHHQTRTRMLLRKLAFGAEYANLRWRVPVPSSVHRAIQQSTDNKLKLFEFILHRTQRQFVVDSSKHYLGALNLYRAAPHETRIIHLLRDGRAVFNSGIRRGLRPRSALIAWSRHCKRAAGILGKHLPASAAITVHYEDLASEPETELQRVCTFLGIDYRPGMLEFATADSHIANGNRMRLGQSSEIRLDERWRQDLSEPMLDFFETHAGTLNRQLGYIN